MSAEFEIVLHIAFAITMTIAAAMIVIGIIRLTKKIRFPKYTVTATVVSKRAKARRHGHKTDTGTQIVTDTFCYVTFKEADTNILELRVSVNEYMALNKGESGKLTFQGGNFLRFEKPNGEIVSEAVFQAENAANEESESENKKDKKRRKNQKDSLEHENKKSSKKPRKSKVKAEVEGIGDVDGEIAGATDSETGIETENEISGAIESGINNEAEAETSEADSENNIEASIEAKGEAESEANG